MQLKLHKGYIESLPIDEKFDFSFGDTSKINNFKARFIYIA